MPLNGGVRGIIKWLGKQWLATVGPAMLVFLVLVATDIPEALAARNGDGRLGTWTLTEYTCGGTRCHAWGDFVPDDPGPTLYRVKMSGSDVPLTEVGSRWRALDVDAWNGGVVVPGGGRVYTTIGISVGVGIAVGVWLLSLLGYVLWRRRANDHSA